MALIDDGSANWGCYGPSLVPVLPQAPGGAQHPPAPPTLRPCRSTFRNINVFVYSLYHFHGAMKITWVFYWWVSPSLSDFGEKIWLGHVSCK